VNCPAKPYSLDSSLRSSLVQEEEIVESINTERFTGTSYFLG
jgi:hypothetical protein